MATQTVKTYSIGKPLAEDQKLAPQARCILNAIDTFDGPVSRDELLDELGKTLKTRQPVTRILSYYQPQLVKDGYIVVGEEEVEVEDAQEPRAEQAA